MADLLVVFGITGQQGASVANNVLKHSDLASKYKIRGITRDPSKPEADTWRKKGVEVVKGDTDDRESIKAALQGAHIVYAMTVSIYERGGAEREIEQGKAIADEAVAAGVKFFIYSTVPSPKKITNGKWPVGSFDCKDAVKDYIETLPIKSAFFSPGCFMQNFQGHMGPREGPDGRLAVTNFVKPETPYALIDIAGDTGKFVGAILSNPDKYAGKTFCSATRVYTIQEIVDTMARVTGKDIKYNQIPKEKFGSFLPEASRDTLLNMLSYFEEFGYYGPDTEKEVSWAASNAKDPPISFEQFLKNEPLAV